MPRHLHHYWGVCNWLRLRSRSASATSPCADYCLGSICVESFWYHVQFLYAFDDQRLCKMGRQDWVLVSVWCSPKFTPAIWNKADSCASFAGTGSVAVIIAWFILPEVTCRTPAEIDEM